MSKIKTNQEIIFDYYSQNGIPNKKKKFSITPILITLLVMLIPVLCFLTIAYVVSGK